MSKIPIRATPKLAKASQGQPPSTPPTRMHRRLWLAAKVIVAFVVALIGLAGSIYGMWGAPWPLAPEIHAVDFVSGTPLTHLFKVQNRMAFNIKDAEFTCGVDLVYFKDAVANTGGVNDVAFVTGKFSIQRGEWINYSCDASQLVEASADGSLNLRRELSTKPTVWKPPLTILKMCLWIGGKYRLFGIDWRFRSIIFNGHPPKATRIGSRDRSHRNRREIGQLRAIIRMCLNVAGPLCSPTCCSPATERLRW
jgi:hypothetical protein